MGPRPCAGILRVKAATTMTSPRMSAWNKNGGRSLIMSSTRPSCNFIATLALAGLAMAGLVMAGLVMASLVMRPAKADGLADFYRGRTVALVVGSSTGGGYDAMARAIA